MNNADSIEVYDSSERFTCTGRNSIPVELRLSGEYEFSLVVMTLNNRVYELNGKHVADTSVGYTVVCWSDAYTGVSEESIAIFRRVYARPSITFDSNCLNVFDMCVFWLFFALVLLGLCVIGDAPAVHPSSSVGRALAF